MIQRNDKGDLVAELQGYLAELGFLPGTPDTIDGDFGPKTERAVIAFQKVHKLAPDGIVGPMTIGALGEALKVVPGAEQPERVDGDRFDADGWDREARRWEVHEGRLGKPIDPIGAVVHTTDMMPATFAALCKAWKSKRGEGNAATYLIGRDPWDGSPEDVPTCGLVQLAPITRNANHAGGFSGYHGWLVKGKQRVAHPNSVYTGIEVHAAGKLRKGKDKWLTSGGKVIEADDVFVAPDGTGWHRVTEYQLATLGALLDALDKRCRPVPTGWSIEPHGSHKRNGVTWAPLGLVRFTTHVELDPTRKNDPGPQVTSWMRERYADRLRPAAGVVGSERA